MTKWSTTLIITDSYKKKTKLEAVNLASILCIASCSIIDAEFDSVRSDYLIILTRTVNADRTVNSIWRYNMGIGIFN